MKTKLTVGDTIERLTHLRLKRAVRDEAINYVRQFIITDSYEPPRGIASPVSSDVIPQDIIEEVILELIAEKDTIDKEVSELMGQTIGSAVKDTNTTKQKVAAKKITKKKAVRKPPPKRRIPNAKSEEADEIKKDKPTINRKTKGTRRK